MTTTRQEIYAEIEAERQRQDKKWGGPAHDDQHSIREWSRLIGDHAIDVAGIWVTYETPEELQRRVAAIESFDRKTGKTD